MKRATVDRERRMLTFSSNTLIAYESQGAGEPALVLLPDWGMPRRVFAAVLDLVARRHRVLALDWRGHGESGRAFADFGHRELADDAEAVIAAGAVGRMVLVAHGQAGWPAIELRRRLRERVAGMVLIDWQVVPAHPTFWHGCEGWATRWCGSGPSTG